MRIFLVFATIYTIPVSYTHLKAALALAEKYDVRMPIIEEVNRVLFEDKPAKEAVSELMPVSYTHLDVYKRQVYA